MSSAALATFSLLGPLLAGWLVIERIWPEVTPSLRFGLGIVCGASLTGVAYFFALVVTDSATLGLVCSESLLAGMIVVLFVKRRTVRRQVPDDRSSNRAYAWFVGITATFASAAFLFALDLSRRGGFDALAMWNLRGRLIAISKASPLSAILDGAFLGLHPDYPLLLPSLLARGWQYVGTDSAIVPVMLAALFTMATLIVAIGGIRLLSTKSQSWIGGGILLGTPFLLRHGASQYADIVLCCFITAAVVIYSIYDLNLQYSRLPLLAGIAAGAAACTKNEGILFVVALLVARLVVAALRRSVAGSWREPLGFAGGTSLGVLTIILFKLWNAPQSDAMLAFSAHAALGRVTEGSRNLQIMRGFLNNLNFGQWIVNPMPWMALHAAVSWTSPVAWSRSRKLPPWFTAAFVVVVMLAGIYAVYLVSPYDAEYYVQSSLNRLMLQLWPCVIILYSMIAGQRSPGPSSWKLSRAAALRVATVLALVILIFAFSVTERPSGNASGGKPRIELSRTVVAAGENYAIRISGIAESEVYLSYSLDGKPMGQFSVYLGNDSTVEFPVSATTRKGIYRFLAVRPINDPVWIDFADNVALTVK